MHLREVQMENFKSFGRKLTVPFEPGFTGITGPNGSGKSNIGDAVMFVLGPNSPRAIRAGKLADLIFNGAEKGHGRDHCTVSLVFDNVDRTMPVDADTVTLTRRIKRSPTDDDKDNVNSYFYVNGRASQKKEFVDLLQHAGISADGYNITQQGDVQQLCTMTPQKRREKLDTIAGVTAFDKDIAAADARKAEVQANLDRIAIVLEEIGHSLAQLDKDRAAAARYRELQASIARLKGLAATRRRDSAQGAIAQVQQQLAQFAAERAKHEADLVALRATQKETEAKFAEVQERIRAEGGAEVQEIQAKVEAARDAMVRFEEQLNFARANAQQAREDAAPLQEELQKVVKELARTHKAHGDLSEQHAKAAAQLDARKKELDAARALIAKSDSGAMQLTRDLAALKQDHEARQLEMHEAKLEADRLAERQRGLERAIADAQAARELAQQDLAEATEALKEVREQFKGQGGKQKDAQRRLLELQKAQAELTRQREDLENRIRRGERELAELRAAQEATDRQMGGMGDAVQLVLKARESRSIKGIIGTVAELGKVEDRFKTALHVAAAGRANAILVEDDSVAAACVDLLKKNHAGRATFLPLSKMVPGKPRGQALMKQNADGCLGFALDLIEFNPRYQNAFFNIFGDTLVADTMGSARKMMGGVRIVTVEGELFEASGAITGGSLTKGKKSDEPQFGSGDRARMDALMQEVATAEQMQSEVAQRLVSVRTELEALQAAMASEGIAGASLEDRLHELERRSEAAKERVAAAKADEERLAQEAKVAATSATELAAVTSGLTERLSAMEAERQEKGTLILKGTSKGLREKVEAVEAAIRELTEQSLRLENQASVAHKQLELLEARRKEVATAAEGRGKDAERLVADEKRYAAGHAKAKAEVDALLKMQSKAAGALKGLSEKKDKLYKDLVDLQARVAKVQDRIETHFGLLTNAKAKLPAYEESLAEALAELAQYPVTLAAGEEIPPLDDLKRELRNQEASLDRLGPVNMTALEQYEAQAKRQTELKEETGRLEAQKGDLVRLVGEIQVKKKDALTEVFTAINESFGQVYSQISLGGHAHLELENLEDPFAGGLIIKAQPPGKKVLRIDALSGGEKSLTSMAFIFSLQRYDPSPFYYFDEVDQNLDAVNSELLAKMIRDNSRYAQFIVVSLRKITLKEANHLYGVTQQRPGESEIIANFDIDLVKEEDRKRDDDTAGGSVGGHDGEDDGPAPPSRTTTVTKTKKTKESSLKDTIGGLITIKAEA